MSQSLPRFQDVLESYHDEIYRYVWRLVRGYQSEEQEKDAEDLTQEVFIRAYNAYDRLRPDSNVRAWLYKIATNTTYSATRKRKNRITLPIDETQEEILPADIDGPEDAFLVQEILKSIQDAVIDLPYKQSTAFVLRYIHGFSYGDIADTLDCSQDSARANVYQALKTLRNELAIKDTV